jgi:hypothetical protein
MNAKHLWWIIPLLLIVGGIASINLFSGLIDYTFVNLAEIAGKQLIEYKNKTYIVCGYAASCPADHIEKFIGGQCLECRPSNPDFEYTPFNITKMCEGIR